MIKICEAFEQVKQAEQSCFSEKSFFRRQSRGLLPAESDDDPDLGSEEGAAMHGFVTSLRLGVVYAGSGIRRALNEAETAGMEEGSGGDEDPEAARSGDV